MNLSDLKTRVLEALGENAAAPVYYTAAHATAAINSAQRLFAFLTLCLEAESNLVLNPGDCWYTTDFGHIVIMRIMRGSTKVTPCRLSDLDALDPDWQNATQAAVTRYAPTGGRLFALYPPPASGSVTVTFAKVPAALSSDSDVPSIPVEYHPCLVDGAVVFARLREGGNELQDEMPRLERFMGSIQQMAGYVRARNAANGYDVMPPELKRFDPSKLVKFHNPGGKE